MFLGFLRLKNRCRPWHVRPASTGRSALLFFLAKGVGENANALVADVGLRAATEVERLDASDHKMNRQARSQAASQGGRCQSTMSRRSLLL